MKKILTLLFLLALLFPAGAQIITATVTLTNSAGATNGNTITVNGTLRYFTNTVTSAQNQIQSGTNITMAQTNLFYAYAAYPQSGFNLSKSSTNIVQLQSFSGFPLTVVLSSGWATLVFTTNSITNMVVFRGYASQVGAYERTNTANGIVSYLSSTAVTSSIPSTSPAFVQFAPTNSIATTSNSLRTLIYSVGNGSTNLTYQIGSNGTNFALAASNALSALIYTIGANDTNYATSIGAAATNYVNVASNAIYAGLISGGLSYRTGNDIILKNADGTTRLSAYQSGDLNMLFENGTSFLYANTSHDFGLTDGSSRTRYNQENNGRSVIGSSSGNESLVVTTSDSIRVLKPVAFNTSTWPAVAEGCATNFITANGNSGTGATTVHNFNVPANSMTNDGAAVLRTVGVTFAASSATKRTEVYFAGTQIFDTGSVANTGSGSATVRCEITRTSSSSISYACTGTSDATLRVTYAKVGTIGGLDFTTSQTFYIILTSGVGGASNDFQVIQDNTRFCPSPIWASF